MAGRDGLRELLWRAARITVPLGLLLSGCRVTLAEPAASGDPCTSGGGADCLGRLVKVNTSLHPGVDLSDSECAAICGSFICQSRVLSSPRCVTAGKPGVPADSVYCNGSCVEGRPPRELDCPLPGESAGDLWARMAWFEAQSVVEFERLAVDLERLGAPAALVTKARRAADDERRHARLASGFTGHDVVLEPAPDFAPRDARTLAFDNFLSGCLNETAAAMRVAHQSLTLGGTRGAVLAGIAEDELGHADFSWELHAWLMTTLSEDDRRALALTGERQLEAMRHADEDLDPSVRAETGRPPPEQWAAQLALLTQELWAPAFDALRA